MKIALCLSGHLRSYERAYPSLYKNIIEPYKTDIFIHTWLDQSFDGVRDQGGVKLNINDMEQLYRPTKYLVETIKEWDVSSYQIKPNIGLRDPQIPLSMFYSIYRVNELKKQYEQDNNFIYDVVIRSRGDLLFDTVLTIPDQLKGVYVPPFGSYGGLNDSFAFGTSSLMDLYTSTFPNIDKFYQEGCLFHAESLVKYTANYFNIPILPAQISYGLLRMSGYVFRLAP